MRFKRRALFKIREAVPRCFSFNPFDASRYAPSVMALMGVAQIVTKCRGINSGIESCALGSRELPPRRFDRSLRRTCYLRGAACETIGVILTPHSEHARAQRAILGHYLYQSNPDSILRLT